MQDSTSFFMSRDVYRLCANSRYDILILDYTLGENNPERRILKVIIKRLELWENTTKLLGVKFPSQSVTHPTVVPFNNRATFTGCDYFVKRYNCRMCY